MHENIHNLFDFCKHNVCRQGESMPINFSYMGNYEIDNFVFERLLSVLTDKGMAPSAFQAKLKLRSQDWNNWKTRGVPAKYIFTIAAELDLNSDWLAMGIGQKNKTLLISSGIYEPPAEYKYPRVVGTAQCGDNGYYLDLEGGDGYLEFEAEEGAIAIRIRGHSMHPAIREGWYVVIEPNKKPDINEYVLIKFKDGKKMVKELLQVKTDSYLLLSVNGNERITAMFDDLDGSIQAISAIVPPSKHKQWQS